MPSPLERTIAQLAGPAPAAQAGRAAVGLVALALPFGGALLGAKVAGPKGATAGGLLGLAAAIYVMVKNTKSALADT